MYLCLCVCAHTHTHPYLLFFFFPLLFPSMNSHTFHRKSVLKLSSLPRPVSVSTTLFWIQFKFLKKQGSEKEANEGFLLPELWPRGVVHS